MSIVSKPRLDSTLRFAALVLLAAVAGGASGQQLRPASTQPLASVPDRQRAGNARKATSTFDSAGIVSISCDGAVDWETLFKGQTTASFREEVLPVLKGTRFLVTLERDGTVRVATRATVEPANPEAAARATSSIRNFGGVIATVLQGWASFAVTADLPAGTDEYKLDKAGDHYLMVFKNGSADVAVTLDRYFTMSDGLAESADGSMARPNSTAAPSGYLVTSWNMAFPRGTGRDLSVDARYMPVEGVEVPSEMVLHSSLPSFGEITLPLVLTNYEFQR